jgi:hypothetical protein
MAAVSKNRTYGKIAGFWVIKSKIYLPCNFEVNLTKKRAITPNWVLKLTSKLQGR